MSDAQQAAMDTAKAPITGSFTLTAQMPNARSIQITGYVYEGESLESLNSRMDLLQAAIERQRIRCEIPELEAKLEQTIEGLAQHKAVLADLEREKQASGKTKLASAKEQQLGNISRNITMLLDQIDKGRAAIAEAKKKAGID